jgi:hypothetical protein
MASDEKEKKDVSDEEEEIEDQQKRHVTVDQHNDKREGPTFVKHYSPEDGRPVRILLIFCARMRCCDGEWPQKKYISVTH